MKVIVYVKCIFEMFVVVFILKFLAGQKWSIDGWSNQLWFARFGDCGHWTVAGWMIVLRNPYDGVFNAL